VDAETTTSTPDPTPLAGTASRPNWARIALYIVLAFGISWIIWIGLRALGVAFIVRASIGMFGPAIAATLVRLARREGFADAGLRLTAKGRRGAGLMYLPEP
jgi:uncharacterized protein